MSKLVSILRDNADLLNSLFGNVNDLIVKSRYSDIMNELSTYEKQRNDYNRYLSMSDKVAGVSLDDSEYYNTVTNKGINYDDPNFQKSGAFTKYNEQLKQDYLKNNPDDPNGEKMNLTFTNEDFIKYLEQNPDLQNEINTKYMKDVQSKTLKTKEELSNHIYNKAGFTPEDVQFYNGYKQPNPTEFNNNLTKVLYDNYAGLISSGSYQDLYAKMLQNKVGLLGIMPKPESDYQIISDEKNGTLIYANKKNPNDRKIVQYRDPKLNQKKPELDYSLVTQEADGKFYYYNDVWNDNAFGGKGGYEKQLLRELSPDEVTEYNRKMDIQLKQGEFDPSNNKRGRSSRRSVSGDGMTDKDKTVAKKLHRLGELNSFYNKMSGAQKKEYKQLQKELIDEFKGNYDALNKSAEDVYNSSGKKKDLSKIVKEIGSNNGQSELDKIDAKGNNKKSFFGIDYSSDYEKADQSQKQALDNVSNWVKGILDGWKRKDPREIPINDWAREINEDKDTFSDLEWELLTTMFNQWKSKFNK